MTNNIRQKLGLNPRERRQLEKVKRAMFDCGYFDEIRHKDLATIIECAVGHDPRTVKRVIGRMRQVGIIQRRNQYVYLICKEDKETQLENYDVPDVDLVNLERKA